MSLNELRISADAYLVCLTHVLSTESTEVMGVLLGDVEDGVCRVVSAKALVRLDKRKDRVEISSSQLMGGATEAERLAAELGRTVRVVGWYHSHPHITVWPSVVDIDTQNSYQLMDRCFAGLIFAVFPKRQSAGIQAACFQSVPDETGSLKRRDVPVRIEPTRTIAPHCLRALWGLPEALREEEVATYDSVQQPASNNDQLTEMHNQAVLVSNITQQLGVLTMPLLQLLENRLQRNQRQLRRLLAERDALTERLEGGAVKRELSDALFDSGSDTDRRPSDPEDRSAARLPDAAADAAGSSEETVFLPSAAERELGVSPSRPRIRLESDSDSAGSAEPPRPRRRPVVKRERESDGSESERAPGKGRPRRRLAVVKEEPGSKDAEVCSDAPRPGRTGGRRERRESAASDVGKPRAAPVVKTEPEWYLDLGEPQGWTPSREGDSVSVPEDRTRANVKREPVSEERGDRRRTSRRGDLK